MRVNGKVCRLHVIVDGTKIEPGPIKASEAEKLTAWTGYGLREWEAQVSGGDPLAVRALLALMRFRTGEHVRISDVDIDDVDSIEAELRDERGRVVTVKLDDQADPVVVNGQPVFLFDGEEDDPLPPARAATAPPTD